MDDSTRERLADYAHEAWAGWMRYLFKFGTFTDDGRFLMDADKVTRWRRQMETPYAALGEAEKQSDRKEADQIIAIVAATTLPPSPFAGQTATCKDCGRVIVYAGTHWIHTGTAQPRHIATPKDWVAPATIGEASDGDD